MARIEDEKRLQALRGRPRIERKSATLQELERLLSGLPDQVSIDGESLRDMLQEMPVVEPRTGLTSDVFSMSAIAEEGSDKRWRRIDVRYLQLKTYDAKNKEVFEDHLQLRLHDYELPYAPNPHKVMFVSWEGRKGQSELGGLYVHAVDTGHSFSVEGKAAPWSHRYWQDLPDSEVELNPARSGENEVLVYYRGFPARKAEGTLRLPISVPNPRMVVVQ